MDSEISKQDGAQGAGRSSLHEVFDKCVVRKSKGGRYEIKCRLGLWGVEGPNRESVEGEAMHYWQQYFGDGEYQKHLSNDGTQRPGP